MKMQFSEALGAQAPLGFWDPLGLLKDADQERFDRLRYVSFVIHLYLNWLFIHKMTSSSNQLHKIETLHNCLLTDNISLLWFRRDYSIILEIKNDTDYQLFAR